MDRTAVDRLYDCDLLDRHGERVGTVAELWMDGGRPLWATVRTDHATTLVPIRGAQVRDRRVVVPVDKREIEDAPPVGAEVSEVDHARLHDHYGLSVPQQRLVRRARPAAASGAASPPSDRATRRGR
ncbi:PRC-barrel domain-containing protein [Saccharothrix variisporea]|uniref:PRC-barrel domain protein n=1 Tax=Saccharothrix variisporea TaxID=543527 RepID=A0A495XND0_9PSEU|nr:PRC-barrel domain-containing protein [Saccharothrix variisporea]RKT73148.1 PRC-barrel domain protein [Saccharothrix variisporea]